MTKKEAYKFYTDNGGQSPIDDAFDYFEILDLGNDEFEFMDVNIQLKHNPDSYNKES